MKSLQALSVNSVTRLVCLAAVLLTFTGVTSRAQTFDIVKDEFTEMLFLESADLDMDGERDLVYSGWGTGTTNCFIAFGQGSGLFDTPIQIPPPYQSSIAIDYVDGDGLLDIIAVSGANVYVMLNNGDRTFSTSSFANSGAGLTFVTTGYFNDDSYLDIVASPAKLYLGDGSGGFSAGSDVTGDTLYGADVTDFNKDGYDDLVGLEGQGDGYLWIYLNDGNGNFSTSDSLALGSLSLSVSTNNALADFNNDGNPDFVMLTPLIGAVSCSSGYHVTEGLVGLGDGNGGILDTTKFEVCGTAYNLCTGDVNNDYELDIIVSNASFKRLEILRGNGDGTFQSNEMVALGAVGITHVLTEGDFDNDGNIDFVTNGSLNPPQDSIYTALNNSPDKEILSENMKTTGYTSVDFGITNPFGHRISRIKNSVAGARFDRRDDNDDGELDAQSFDNNLQYGDYTLVFKKKPNITSPATFDATVQIGESQTLRLFKDYETPGTARGSAADDSVVIHLAVEQYPSVSPVSGGTVFDDQPMLLWSGLFSTKNGSADTYDFQLDSKVDFSSPIVDATGLSNRSYSIISSLARDQIYYWRVRSFDGAEYSEWSIAHAVYVGPFFCGDVNNDGTGPNIVDLTYIVDYVFRSGPPAPVAEYADLNGDSDSGNILDLTAMVDFLFRLGAQPMCGI